MSGFVPQPYTRTNPFEGIGNDLMEMSINQQAVSGDPTFHGKYVSSLQSLPWGGLPGSSSPTGISINPQLQQATEMELPRFGKIGGMFNKAGGWGGLLSGLEGGISDWAKQQQASQVNDYDYMTPVSMANQVGGLSGGYFSGY